MNDFDKARTLWGQKLALWALSFELRNTLAFMHHKLFIETGVNAPQQELPTARIRKAFEKLPSVREEVEQLMPAHISALAEGRYEPDALSGLLNREEASIDEELASIPASLDKAKACLMAFIESGEYEPDQVYDAIVLMADRVEPSVIQDIVAQWKSEAHQHEKRLVDAPIPVTKIFWTSRDFMENLDGVSRYRFCDRFAIGEFEDAMREVEAQLAATLMVGFPASSTNFTLNRVDPQLGVVAYDTWLGSRSTKLASRIRHFLELALAHIANCQHPEGWWPSPLYDQYAPKPKDGKAQPPFWPDPYLTALAAVDILRLSRQEWQLERGRDAVRWLVGHQNNNGSWRSLTAEGDVFATVHALEAVRVSGLGGFDNSLQLGESWLMGQQQADGTWPEQGTPLPFTTILVLEYFEQVHSRLGALNDRLSVARYFLSRSQEFALEDSGNSRRLGIIAAYQGLEQFLYACLSVPAVNVPIFQSKAPNKTIGFRAALDALEKHLRGTGVLPPGTSVDYRNSLDELAYYRDEIVHKGMPIEPEKCRALTADACRFANEYCQQILGHRLV